MNTTTVRINWDFVSRIFIGSLFIYAGIDKLMNFNYNLVQIDRALSTGSMTPALLSIAIFIEIVVAALYIWGKWKRDVAGYILVAFTAIVTLLLHSDLDIKLNVIMAMKNLAIIGGIIATLDVVHKKRVLHTNN